nr:MAG TPA: hypothetical protein [Caudoviricetes sp.]
MTQLKTLFNPRLTLLTTNSMLLKSRLTNLNPKQMSFRMQRNSKRILSTNSMTLLGPTMMLLKMVSIIKSTLMIR